MRTNLVCLILLGASLPVGAQTAQIDNRLIVRPWVELKPLVRIDNDEHGNTLSASTPYPIPVAKAERALLEDARVLLSGMVYGWSFDYTPANRARQVAETFTLTPTAQIPWGSPRLRVVETEAADEKLWARTSYSMDDAESARRASWESSAADLSQGEGKASAMKGPEAKMLSFQDAVRDAIRLDLRTRYLDAPRQIRGDVVLWEDPMAAVRSGMYRTVVKVKIVVRELVPYRIF
ncbi:MAG TPA: hypothetical protein VMU36_05925 [Spirochaetia bacterium]|nr:hypothetical protein [Spirochaetia bacterium]